VVNEDLSFNQICPPPRKFLVNMGFFSDANDSAIFPRDGEILGGGVQFGELPNVLRELENLATSQIRDL
jgi:hypothetical protein